MKQALTKAVIERLESEGHLSSLQVAELGAKKSISGQNNLKSLLAMGIVPERAFASALSALQQVELLQKQQYPSTLVAGTESLREFFIEHEALPVNLHGDCMHVAMSDPSDQFILNVLRAKLGYEIVPLVAVRSELLAALNDLYPSATPASASLHHAANVSDGPQDLHSDSALVRDLHRLLQRAITMGASDIHFEPVEQALRVRFRVTGTLREIDSFPAQVAPQVIARLKLMAKLDVTERRQAQNGRFKFPADGRMIDLRVSTLPLHDGESIVLRLLESALSRSSLSELGFRQSVTNRIEQVIKLRQGLVLITGPTGSGKSTTLYSLLNQLNATDQKLISIEDPVELQIEGINQIQIDEEHGIGFAQALKSVLRQDPDIIMVGEIRDAATARLAAQAALTGHLVLSTLHTPSAAAAVTRLQNLGLQDYLIAATLKAVVAQRLVRCLCTDCSGQNQQCSNCDGIGYSGRTVICEFLPLTDAAETSLDESQLAKRLADGISLAQDADRIVDAGLSDYAEIYRVLGTSTARQNQT